MAKAAVVAGDSLAEEKVAVVEEVAGVVVVEGVAVRVAVAVLVAVLAIVLPAVLLPRVGAVDAVGRVKRMVRARPPRPRAVKVKVKAHRSPRAKAEVGRTTLSVPVTAWQFREPTVAARYPSRGSRSCPRRCGLND
jgi:hypothetical protein